MLAQLSQWILIAALGQAPPEAALLKAAPADVDLAVRIRGVEAAREDLLAMLRAMNPDWADAAEGALAGPLAHFREMHGARASQAPFLALVRLDGAGGDAGPPPFAILLPAEDYKAAIRELAGGKDVELKRQDGDYDAFDGPGGHTWYSAHPPGLVAFGLSKDLIAAIAGRGGKTLDAVLSGPAARSFFGGDVGLYVNAAALTRRYADQIEQARQMFMAAIDQAGQQGNEALMRTLKEIYGKIFDSIRDAEGLTLHLDFARKGAHLAAYLAVKADPGASKAADGPRRGSPAGLDKLPPDAAFYAQMDLEARTFEKLMSMGVRMYSQDGKTSPALEKASEQLRAGGRIESLVAVMEKGSSIAEVFTADPGAYIDGSIAAYQAMKVGEGGAGGLYKDVQVQRDAQTVGGLKFTRVAPTLDPEQAAKLVGTFPGQADMMKTMLGRMTSSYWYGTDGKRLIQVGAHDWEEARSLLDAYNGAGEGVGRTAGFKAMRAELPERANLLLLVHTQRYLRMLITVMAAATKNPDLKLPADLPVEPAYVGMSSTDHPPGGYELHLVVPSSAGTVIAKALPMARGVPAPGANP